MFGLLVGIGSLIALVQADQLRVGNGGFMFGSQQVFLSGANQAWIDYGNDFGNNQTNAKYCELRSYVHNVSAAGGNTIRMWLFVEGQQIPLFSKNGMVIATDSADSLIPDLLKYIRYAASQNVFVNLVLWNGAVLRNQNVVNFFSDSSKLGSFVDKVLTPMMQAIGSEPGLGAIEIMNEPEGSLQLESDPSNPCFDSEPVLKNTGAGWNGHLFTMKQLLTFVNVQAAAIHQASPNTLVTLGSWSVYPSTSAFPPFQSKGFFNFYTDACLRQAGGQDQGHLDFYQVHTYPAKAPAEGGDFDPFSRTALEYKLDKPLVIGEFADYDCSKAGCTPQAMSTWAFNGKYNGAWYWALNDDSHQGQAAAAAGMAALSKLAPGSVHVDIGGKDPGDTCSCSDVPPPGQYTCEQQAGWGKCGESFMKGFCCRSCHACVGCQ
mmetsp:Transcript_21226/g.42146  ORF Transcript_21226/g.42146 Transcript_21226/m.42146 type:complete len:433 (+) Transcript_21226:41-1339(+)